MHARDPLTGGPVQLSDEGMPVVAAVAADQVCDLHEGSGREAQIDAASGAWDTAAGGKGINPRFVQADNDMPAKLILRDLTALLLDPGAVSHPFLHNEAFPLGGFSLPPFLVEKGIDLFIAQTTAVFLQDPNPILQRGDFFGL